MNLVIPLHFTHEGNRSTALANAFRGLGRSGFNKHREGTQAVGIHQHVCSISNALLPDKCKTAGNPFDCPALWLAALGPIRSEEHTSELQSRENLVCRLLLEKKK